MRNERDITIKVIENNTINIRKLAKYFAEKYELKIQEGRSQKS